MQIYNWNQLDSQQKSDLLKRPKSLISPQLKSSVSSILDQVEAGDEQTLLALTEKFDHVSLNKLEVSQSELQSAFSQLEVSLKEAIEKAYLNIEFFHRKQLPLAIESEREQGILCQRVYRPIESVGLYVPAGTAPLFSTVLMLAIPAALAGCEQIILCTPPQKDGRASASVLAAAALCGVTQVFTIGGAQAIGAMAFGCGPVPQVNKIFGPGNSWVTEAKTQVMQRGLGVSIDMPAGPSEVLIIADESADSELVAWDLLSQAEHGADSQSILVSTSDSLCLEVQNLVAQLIQKSPRKSLLLESVTHMRAFVVDDLLNALKLSNSYGPEHLILNCRDARGLVSKIKNAGSVFVGALTPESAGDYASGTNHVLPTSGFAKSMGGLTVESFMKSMTVQELSRDGVRTLGPVVEKMAEAEGLWAHQQAMSVRRKMLEGNP